MPPEGGDQLNKLIEVDIREDIPFDERLDNYRGVYHNYGCNLINDPKFDVKLVQDRLAMQGNQQNLYEYIADQFGKDIYLEPTETFYDDEHQPKTPKDMDLYYMLYDLKKGIPNPKVSALSPKEQERLLQEDRLR